MTSHLLTKLAKKAARSRADVKKSAAALDSAARAGTATAAMTAAGALAEGGCRRARLPEPRRPQHGNVAPARAGRAQPHQPLTAAAGCNTSAACAVPTPTLEAPPRRPPAASADLFRGNVPEARRPTLPLQLRGATREGTTLLAPRPRSQVRRAVLDRPRPFGKHPPGAAPAGPWRLPALRAQHCGDLGRHLPMALSPRLRHAGALRGRAGGAAKAPGGLPGLGFPFARLALVGSRPRSADR